MRIFDPKDPAEIVVLTFDCGPDLAQGETLTGAPAVSISQFTGVVQNFRNSNIPDPNVASILSGPAQFSGNTALQKVQAGLAGNIYALSAVCTTSNGRQLVIGGMLPVISAVLQ